MPRSERAAKRIAHHWKQYNLIKGAAWLQNKGIVLGPLWRLYQKMAQFRLGPPHGPELAFLAALRRAGRELAEELRYVHSSQRMFDDGKQQTPSLCILDFRTDDELKYWTTSSDKDRGGTSRMKPLGHNKQNDALHFTGYKADHVLLKNGELIDGYCLAKSQGLEELLDITDFPWIAIKARITGTCKYFFAMEADNYLGTDVYNGWLDIEPSDDWSIFMIPVGEFTRTVKGDLGARYARMDTTRIRSFAIQIYGKGIFRIEVQWVHLARDIGCFKDDEEENSVPVKVWKFGTIVGSVDLDYLHQQVVAHEAIFGRPDDIIEDDPKKRIKQIGYTRFGARSMQFQPKDYD